jgi:hypothetical protein
MPNALSLVRMKYSADDVHRMDGELLDACCSFTLGWPSTLATKLLQCCHLIPQKITATIM